MCQAVRQCVLLCRLPLEVAAQSCHVGSISGVLQSVFVQKRVCAAFVSSLHRLDMVFHIWSVAVQVKMRDLLVKVGRYPCGSLDVEVSSSGLAIADRRHVAHMPQHLSIITITPDQPDGAGSSDKFAPWDTVRSFVTTNVYMPEFSRLARESSFERRHSIRRATSSINSVLTHRRSPDDKPDRSGLHSLLPLCLPTHLGHSRCEFRHYTLRPSLLITPIQLPHLPLVATLHDACLVRSSKHLMIML